MPTHLQGFVSLLLLLLSGASITCTSTVQPKPVSPDRLAVLRVEVRRIIRPGCGSCHTTGLPTAKPAALAVFDLAQDDWSAPMTESELHGLQSRTKDIRDTLAAKVEALVAAELALRGKSEVGGWKAEGEGPRPMTND